jgi:hypothetical protein
MKPDGPRDPIAGPDDGPASPFPIKLGGKVIKGFGRGSKEVCYSYAFLRSSSFLYLFRFSFLVSRFYCHCFS